MEQRRPVPDRPAGTEPGARVGVFGRHGAPAAPPHPALRPPRTAHRPAPGLPDGPYRSRRPGPTPDRAAPR
ncbi:hypothetical protein AB0I98_47730 [Streptomyces sp. NPDC050211]|uniref:hypothetical protein n=1 Tax=Streptomyces sp. NPDC050211 TaxID=3154932 RepID=UPI00343C7E12